MQVINKNEKMNKNNTHKKDMNNDTISMTVIGSRRCGKTSMIKKFLLGDKYIHKKEEKEYDHDIWIYSKLIELSDNSTAKIVISDVNCLDSLSVLENANIIVIMASLNSKRSMLEAENLLNTATQHSGACILVLINIFELKTATCFTDDEFYIQWKKRNNQKWCHFAVCCTQTGDSVISSMSEILKLYVNRCEEFVCSS